MTMARDRFLYGWVLTLLLLAQTPFAHATVDPAIVYPLDYRTGEVRFFDVVRFPLTDTARLPEDPQVRVRYCPASGQAKVLKPQLEGDHVSAIVFVPIMSRLCAELHVVDSSTQSIDGVSPVDLEADQKLIDTLIARVGPMGTAQPSDEGYLPGQVGYLAVQIVLIAVILLVGALLFHLLRRHRELLRLVRDYRRLQRQRINPGFIIKHEIRVSPRGDSSKPRISLVDATGSEIEVGTKTLRREVGTTTQRRADILRDLLLAHPEPIPRHLPPRSPNKPGMELINAVEIGRIRDDLAPLIGKLMAKQLVRNIGNHLSLDPQLYQPPTTPREREPPRTVKR